MVATVALFGIAGLSLVAKRETAGAVTSFALIAAVLYLYAS